MIGDNGAGYLWKLVIRCGFEVEISTVGVHLTHPINTTWNILNV